MGARTAQLFLLVDGGLVVRASLCPAGNSPSCELGGRAIPPSFCVCHTFCLSDALRMEVRRGEVISWEMTHRLMDGGGSAWIGLSFSPGMDRGPSFSDACSKDMLPSLLASV